MKIKILANIFTSGFGVGNLKYFPGTVASFFILPIVWFIKENIDLKYFLLIIFIYTCISIFLVSICIKELNEKDPKFIVVDEHIGQAISLIFCDQKILEYLLSFVLFRFFDIVKPFPISFVDKNIKNSFGVILDDVLAGVIVCIIIFYLI
jgi:phosphatidylglycerophosphatase A